MANFREALTAEKTDRVPSGVIVGRMNANEEGTWAGQMNPRRLASLLRPFGIRPRSLWTQNDGKQESLKGYFLEDARDAFSRYLPDSTTSN